MHTPSLSHAFFALEPDQVLKSTEMCGFRTTGEFTQLNSYENRVFDIVLEEPILETLKNPHIIAKFYRPGRWSKESILEEHEFLKDLKLEGIPVISPMNLPNKSTLFNFKNMWVAYFPKFQGRMPQEFLAGELKQVGRLLARMHNVGSRHWSEHRPVLDTSYYGGWSTLESLGPLVAVEMWPRYYDAAQTILNYLDQMLYPEEFIRIHGDCHKGNLLQDSAGFFFVDFDDCCMGPAVQDFWMLFSNDLSESKDELDELLSGYEELRAFDRTDLDLIPALRGLRIISYAGWIAARWGDPSFPKLFPNFGEYSYWAEETEALERIAWSL